MPTPTRTPPQNHPENHVPKPHHHHTPRYYARQVRESLTHRFSKCLCYFFLILLLIIGVISFILWLNLRPHRPRFHVIAFSLPALNQENGFQNAVISFDVTDRNPNRHIGIFYDAMHGEVYYRERRIGFTPLLFPFYQQPKNTTWIHGDMGGASLTVDDEYWKRFVADRDTGTVGFRLELTAIIHFKVSRWDTKHHRMHASCTLEVGSDGEILAKWKHRRCSLYF